MTLGVWIETHWLASIFRLSIASNARENARINFYQQHVLTGVGESSESSLYYILQRHNIWYRLPLTGRPTVCKEMLQNEISISMYKYSSGALWSFQPSLSLLNNFDTGPPSKMRLINSALLALALIVPSIMADCHGPGDRCKKTSNIGVVHCTCNHQGTVRSHHCLSGRTV